MKTPLFFIIQRHIYLPKTNNIDDNKQYVNKSIPWKKSSLFYKTRRSVDSKNSTIEISSSEWKEIESLSSYCSLDYWVWNSDCQFLIDNYKLEDKTYLKETDISNFSWWEPEP